MSNEHDRTNMALPPTERLEKIYQLCLVGRAALNTNITDPHIDAAVAELLEVVEDIATWNYK